MESNDNKTRVYLDDRLLESTLGYVHPLMQLRLVSKRFDVMVMKIKENRGQDKSLVKENDQVAKQRAGSGTGSSQGTDSSGEDSTDANLQMQIASVFYSNIFSPSLNPSESRLNKK
jgi:hypothetical protein